MYIKIRVKGKIIYVRLGWVRWVEKLSTSA